MLSALRPVFCPYQGQVCDLEGADALLPTLQAPIVIADKGYDADQQVLQLLTQAGKTAIIPSKANRKLPREYGKHCTKCAT